MKKNQSFKKIILLLSVSFIGLQSSGLSPWKEVKSMLTPRNVFALVPCSGKLYAIGGENSIVIKSVEAYDPQTDIWEPKADLPEPLCWSQGFEINNLIYLVCNQTINYRWTKVVYAYNPLNNRWSQKAEMPICNNYMKAVKINNSIYVLADSLAIRYQPDEDKWDTICPLDPQRNLDVSCIGFGNKIYSIGTEVQVFDLSSKKWTKLKSLPNPRTGVGLIELNGKIYSISGYINDKTNWFSRNMESYDPQVDEWTVESSLPSSTTHLPAYATLSGQIYYAGGLLNPRRYINVLSSVFTFFSEP